MQTTNTAAQEIRDFLLSAKASAEQLEAAVTAAHIDQTKQRQTLEAVQTSTTEMHSWMGNMRATLENIPTQLTTAFSLIQHLEKWIQKVVEYCKSIIGQVQRNTEMLLSLHRLVTDLEMSLRRPGIGLPVLDLENPFGIRMALPFQLCDTWEVRT